MDKVKVLAAAVFEASERVNKIKLNRHNSLVRLTYEEKKRDFIAYEVAKTELLRAERALEAEQSI